MNNPTQQPIPHADQLRVQYRQLMARFRQERQADPRVGRITVRVYTNAAAIQGGNIF